MSRELVYGFSYFTAGSFHFLPRTQAAALKAIEAGLLPEESYIFKAVNIRPIFEEPYDIMEIERLLARKDLDIGSAVLLMRIFERLIISADKELALFAAESINALEQRYNLRIHALKKAFAEQAKPTALRSLVRSLYELGLLNFARPVLQNFYLAEAFRFYQENWQKLTLKQEDVEAVVNIVLEMGKIDLAEKILNSFLASRKQDPHLLYLMARVQFAKRDYLRVMSLLVFLNDGNRLPEVDKVYKFWIGEDSHE